MAEFRSSSDADDHDRTVVDPAVMAERRARRAEISEESLADRVRAAEELSGTLRHRTDELERELAAAARERDELLSQLRSRERVLTTVQQQEESERRRRHEVEVESDADRRRLEQEVSDLRVRVGAAETWTAELSAELTQTRNALDAARRELDAERAARLRIERGSQDHAALSQALEARREEMAAEVAALRAQAGGLAKRLAGEERERAQAQAGLAAERERAEAQITLLQHELDRRSEIHDAVLAQLRGLGGEVARVRDGVAQDAERRAASERTLAEVGVTARRLRDELERHEQARDLAAAELQAAQGALVLRDDALVKARAEVGAVRADLEAVLADAAREASALTDVRQRLEDAQSRLAAAQHGLATSQEELAAARQELTTSQDELGTLRRTLADREQSLADSRAAADALLNEVQNQRGATALALAEQQEGFREQIAGFEGTVVDLRGRLSEAARQFDQRLGEEHAARAAAQRELAAQAEAFAAERQRLESAHAELAASHARLAGELVDAHHTIQVERERADAGEALAEQVRGDRDRLAVELARREALDEHVRGTLQSLRVELDDLRVESDARDAREAAVERLVSDLVNTARELREGFDRELNDVRGRLEARGQSDLDAADQRLAAMRGHLESSVDQLRDELRLEQAARRAAEESLGAERTRVEAAGLAAVDAAVARDDLARELRTRFAAEADVRAALATAEEELALLRRDASPAQEDALAVVESLTRAARRLREESALEESRAAEPQVEAPKLEKPAAKAPEAAAEPEAEPEPAPEQPKAVVPEVAPRPSPFAPTTVAGAARIIPAPPMPRVEPSEVALRTDAVPVRPRVVPAEDRTATAWLTPALVRLAEEDPAVAVSALVSLLPALGSAATKAVRCDVTVREGGTWRVALTPGFATVATLTRESGDPDVTLVGSVAALAPLVGGGAPRRLRGVNVIGRRRRLRKLLKNRQAPVALTDVQRAGITPSAGVLLGLLARGVHPEWVGGSDVVDFAVSGAYGGTWRVSTAPGEIPRVTVPAPGSAKPDATIHVADVSVLALLAALPLPPGERLLIGGDVDAASAVTGLLARVQGLVAVAV